MPKVSIAQNERIYRFSVHSPEAASLGKFSDVPVSLNTGIPSISVPFYTIDLKDLSIPISINYHAGGIKVEEQASYVGLGWSLSSGGVINQIKNGMNDFTRDYGWLHTNEKVVNNANMENHFIDNGIVANQTAEYSFAIRASKNEVDTEADLFTYSIPGNSGKFYFNQSGDYVFSPQNMYKLSYQQNINEHHASAIIIRDDNGNRFVFSEVEKTLSIPEGGNSPSHPAFSWASTGYTDNYTYSYNLSKIITNKNDTVFYTYENTSTIIINNYSQTRYAKTANSFDIPVPDGSSSRAESLVHAKRIKTINTTKGHRIEFIYDSNARKDVVREDNSSSALTTVQVFFKSKLIKHFDLEYGYFGDTTTTDPDDSRLKLKRVIENGAAHQFNYNNEEGGFPNRLSMAQDHWGYFNGRSNTTLLPDDPINDFNIGADRNAYPGFSQLGMLKEILNPTGGKTVFEYESNDCLRHDTGLVTKVNSVRAIAMKGEVLTKRVSIPTGAKNIKAFWQGPSVTGSEYIYFTNSSTVSISFNGNSPINGTPLKNGLNNVDPGEYDIMIFQNTGTGNDYYFKVQWEYDKIVDSVYNVVVGGNRVKSIKFFTDKTDLTPAIKKFYSYRRFDNNLYSSGVNGFVPSYTYTINKARPVGGGGNNTVLKPFVCQVSGSTTSLAIFNGEVAVYDNVTELVDSLGVQGTKQFYYSNIIHGSNKSSFPFPPAVFKSWESGLLKKVKINKNDNGTSKEISNSKNEYFINKRNYATEVMNIKYSLQDIAQTFRGETNGYDYETLFGVNSYYLFTGESRLTKESSTQFNTMGDSVTIVKEYKYDNTGYPYPTSIITGTSQSDRLYIERKTYALDIDTILIVNNESKWVNNLIRNNAIAVPIEEISQVKSVPGNSVKTVGGLLYHYNPTRLNIDSVSRLPMRGLNDFEPLHVSSSGTLQRDANYKTDLHLTQYDRWSNLIEQQKTDDITEVYIWGYNSSYPVARIINSTYDVVNGYINQDLLDNAVGGSDDGTVRNHLSGLRSIPNTLVHLYTYLPLIGLTSETAPNGKTIFYEYDSFNRLHLVKDDEGKILKRICYNYTGQVEDCGIALNTTPQWIATGLTRCQPCPANNSYTSNVQEHQEKDNNPNSPTYNTYRWVSDGVNGSCASPADWQNTSTAIRCKKNGSNQNTGEQEREQKDMNPCSSTYNQVRWVVTGTNLTSCPLPVTCSTSNCTGANKKCINNVCRTGIKVYTNSVQVGSNYQCTYHYEWSDGSWSIDYTETNSSPCSF